MESTRNSPELVVTWLFPPCWYSLDPCWCKLHKQTTVTVTMVTELKYLCTSHTPGLQTMNIMCVYKSLGIVFKGIWNNKKMSELSRCLSQAFNETCSHHRQYEQNTRCKRTEVFGQGRWLHGKEHFLCRYGDLSSSPQYLRTRIQRN